MRVYIIQCRRGNAVNPAALLVGPGKGQPELLFGMAAGVETEK